MVDKGCFDIKTLNKDTDSIDILQLSCEDAIIEDLLDYTVNLKVTKYKVIKGCDEYKLIIKGVKIIQVRYTTKDKCGKILTKKFIIPFFHVIPVDPCSSYINIKVKYCYYEVDFFNCTTFIFNNIINFNIKQYFKPLLPQITCECVHDKSNSEWNYKSDNCQLPYFKVSNPIYVDTSCKLESNICNESFEENLSSESIDDSTFYTITNIEQNKNKTTNKSNNKNITRRRY